MWCGEYTNYKVVITSLVNIFDDLYRMRMLEKTYKIMWQTDRDVTLKYERLRQIVLCLAYGSTKIINKWLKL